MSPKPAPTSAPDTRGSKPAADMPTLNVTQAIFDKLIRDAVRSGEVDRAWRFWSPGAGGRARGVVHHRSRYLHASDGA